MLISPVQSGSTIVQDVRTCRGKDGAAFQVREYRGGERADLERFYDEFEPKRAAQGLPPEEPGRIRRWLDGILATGTHFVAVRNGELIGHAFLTPTRTPGVAEYAVFLREDLRGRGLGTALNRVVVEAARERGLRGLWLSVESVNRPAIRSYQKAGFQLVPATIFTTEVEMELSFGSSNP